MPLRIEKPLIESPDLFGVSGDPVDQQHAVRRRKFDSQIWNLESSMFTATIAAVDTFAVTYPVTGFFKFFRNRDGTAAGRQTVVVRVRDESGHVGWE